MTIDLENNKTNILNKSVEPWRVTLLETGPNTMTGGRISQARDYLEGEKFF